ncbi:MAG TPA: type II secretion system protein GspK, partial [Planctomycetota bacterium]|nr:type II secretion system protein GspK [Planctomycetota bacterium]
AVNLNTAPAEVLASLSDKMTLALGDEIVRFRGQPKADGTFQDFKAVADLGQIQGMSGELLAELTPQVVVRSSTFEIRVRSDVGAVSKDWIYVVGRTAGAQGGITLLGSQRRNDFLSAKPPEEEQP